MLDRNPARLGSRLASVARLGGTARAGRQRAGRARQRRERSASLLLQAGALPARRRRSGVRTLLFYNTMFGDPIELPPEGLPDGFVASGDLRRFKEADAVVFHLPSLGRIRRLKKRPGQIWVAWWMEADDHVTCLADPDFMGRFDLTMSYHREADVFVSYVAWFDESRLRAPPRAKSEIAALFTSGSVETSGRTAYTAELMRHMDVHSYGASLRNRSLAEDRGRVTKLETIAGYRFTLALENAIDRDYVTEKLYGPLAVGSVPVYLGAPNVEEMAPSPDSYVDATDFEDPAALADHLIALSRDPAAYERHLAWKAQPFSPDFEQLLESQRTHFLTRLCRLISQA